MVDSTLSGTDRLFQLQVISPERVLVDTRARSIQAAGADGMLGVLFNHAPLVTPLVPGILTVDDGSGQKKYAVGEGFLEVVDNHVNVLVDSAERPEEIDEERAVAALKRAEERLQRRGLKDVDYARAEAALRRAIARLRTIGRR